MPKLTTENNIPNIKVVVMTVVGFAIPLYLTVAKQFGLPSFDPQWMSDNVEAIMGGVVAVMAIVGYLKAPRQGDGVKPAE